MLGMVEISIMILFLLFVFLAQTVSLYYLKLSLDNSSLRCSAQSILSLTNYIPTKNKRRNSRVENRVGSDDVQNENWSLNNVEQLKISLCIVETKRNKSD